MTVADKLAVIDQMGMGASEPTASEPTSQSAASKPSSQSAASKPSSQSAASKPSSQSAASKPSSQSAASKPSSQSAASKPSSQSAASKPSSQSAASKPSSQSAASKPAASKPTPPGTTTVNEITGESLPVGKFNTELVGYCLNWKKGDQNSGDKNYGKMTLKECKAKCLANADVDELNGCEWGKGDMDDTKDTADCIGHTADVNRFSASGDDDRICWTTSPPEDYDGNNERLYGKK